MWYYDYIYGETEDEGIVNMFVFMLKDTYFEWC